MPKLLLIDDDKEVLKINAKYFIQDGYTVKAATNARTAYKLLKDYTPDCIVLDVMMPGIDGFKACTELKKLCQAPVIFLTGRDSEDDKVQGLLLGADDYMIKPYSLSQNPGTDTALSEDLCSIRSRIGISSPAAGA